MLDFVLLGTSGMAPLPNRAFSSCFVRLMEKGFLFDCGEGTQVELMRNNISTNQIDYIVITHDHADHMSGLLGVLLLFNMQQRTKELTIIGPSAVFRYISGFKYMLRGMSYNYICQSIEGIGSINPSTQRGKLTLNYTPAEHSVPCYAYSLIYERSKRFNADNPDLVNIPLRYRSHLASGIDVDVNGKTYYAKDFLKPALKGCKFSYVTDTRPNRKLRKFIEGSNIALVEGMFDEQHNYEDAVRKRHMLWSESVWLVKDNNVDKCILTHYSPSLQDIKYKSKSFSQENKGCYLGYDGMKVHLDFPKDTDFSKLESDYKDKEDTREITHREEIVRSVYRRSNFGKLKVLHKVSDYKYIAFLEGDEYREIIHDVFIYKDKKSMKYSYDFCVDRSPYYVYIKQQKNNS